VDGNLVTKEEHVTISNNIWDGQSLIDQTLMGMYDCYGMVLLINRFFKSCCFNCNIQKWFQYNHITEISQLNGRIDVYSELNKGTLVTMELPTTMATLRTFIIMEQGQLWQCLPMIREIMILRRNIFLLKYMILL